MSAPSALDRLRARYKELQGQPAQTFEVPIRRAAAGDLVVVYQEPDWLETQEIRDRWMVSDDPRAPLYGQAELLAKACVDIKLRDGEQFLPGLGLENGNVSFHAAATALGLTIGDDPLQAVFAVLGNDWEVERHGQQVATWEPTIASPEVEDEFVGESEAVLSLTSLPAA